ncbi:MAG: MFS transporter [Firmicutes bacterium]|nr:MFS transporter [Bacillota bacterium]
MERDSITFRHALLVFACCIFSAGAVGITGNCMGQYVTPLAQALDKPVGTITVFITLISLSTAFVAPFISKVMAKVHVRLVMSFGVILNCLCLCAFAFVRSVSLLYTVAIVLGIANVCFNLIPVTLLLNNWFYKNIGTFTGIVASMSGVAGAVFNPVIAGMINTHGYKYAFFMSALIICASCLPCALFLVRYHPQEFGVLPYGFNEFQNIAPKRTGEDKSFKLPFYILFFIILYVVIQNGIAGLNPSIAAMANSIPLKAGLSATMVSAAMIGNVGSKLVFGVLVDKIGAKLSITAMNAIAFFGLLILSALNPGSNWIALFGCLIYGCVFACSANGAAMLMRELYGPTQFASLYPTVTTFATIAYAGSVAIIGFAYDLLGTYSIPVLVLAGLCIVDVGILFIIQIAEKVAKKKANAL